MQCSRVCGASVSPSLRKPKATPKAGPGQANIERYFVRAAPMAMAEDPPVEEPEVEPEVVPRHCLTCFVLGVRFVYARSIRMRSTVAQ